MVLRLNVTSSIFNFRVIGLPVALLGTLLLGEASMRLHYFGVDALWNALDYSAAGPLEHDILQADSDSQIGWRLRANLDTRFKGAVFQTSDDGFRSPPISKMKPIDTLRIVILGRSITMGAGVSNEEVYPAQLQSLLDRHTPGRYEVLNLAVAAYELPQMMALYESVQSYEADMVMVPMTSGTFSRLIHTQPQRWETRPWSDMNRLLSHFFLYDALRKALGDWKRRHLATDWPARVKPEHRSAKKLKPQTLLREFIMRRLHEDVPVVIVMLRTYWDAEESQQANIVGEVRRWTYQFSNASLIDTTQALKGRIGDSDFIYYGDEHPNAKVHRLYAQVIHASLPPILRRYGLD